MLKRLFIGLPIGLEFFFMALVMGVILGDRGFGADAQAGLAEAGAMRFIALPAMAVAFAAALIAGQDWRAQAGTVREPTGPSA